MKEQVLLAPPKWPTKRQRTTSPKGNGTTQVERVEQLQKAPLQKIIDIPKFKMEEVTVDIVGKTPLIVHAWSEKAIRQMLDKQMGVPSKGREKKDPFEDFKNSLYPVPGQPWVFGVPAPAFKCAAVNAANLVELQMTKMRMAFHVKHYIVPVKAKPIEGPEDPVLGEQIQWNKRYAKELAPYHKVGWAMRMDLVRLESGVADIRFRAWAPNWECQIDLEYLARIISLAQLLNLIQAGGEGSGICEWRPSAPVSRSGEFGRFTLASKYQ